MRPEEYEGEMIDPRSSTTEDEHAHYCEMCGGVWSHEDEACVGPRWEGKMYWGSSWDCPRCAADGR